MEVIEVKCMRTLFLVNMKDRVSNEEVCRSCASEVNIVERFDRNVLRSYCHVDRMGNEIVF